MAYSPATLECGCCICPTHTGAVLEGRDYLMRMVIDLQDQVQNLEAELRGPIESCVYFIRRHSDGLVKIGTTTQFAERVRALSRQHGPLTVLGSEVGDLDRERELHHRFETYRREGEWFEPTGILKAYLEVLTSDEAVRA